MHMCTRLKRGASYAKSVGTVLIVGCLFLFLGSYGYFFLTSKAMATPQQSFHDKSAIHVEPLGSQEG